MRTNCEIFLLAGSTPADGAEFPVSIWMPRVPTIGEEIELADAAASGYADLLLTVKQVIWRTDRKMNGEEPQFREAHPQLGCVISG